MANDSSRVDPSGDPTDWDAVARYVAGESTPEEAGRVRAWLASDGANAAEVARLAEVLRGAPRTLGGRANVDTEAALRRVHQKMDSVDSRVIPFKKREARPIRSGLAWGVLAGLAAAAAIVLSTSKHSGQPAGVPATQVAAAKTYSTKPGQRDSVTLSDGSRVTLGPDSKLTVAAGYGTKTRAVELTGVAYFDVVHDPARPFTLQAGGATIDDIGTTFAVESEDGDSVTVAVTSGSVRLHGADTAAGVSLVAGDVGLIGKGAPKVEHGGANANAEVLAWRDGKMVFRDALLPHVAQEIGRWYGLHVRVADASLLDRHVTHTFAGEPADQVLKIIELTLPARIERHGDSVIIHSVSGK